MNKYVCEPCGYVYDPEVGDPDNGIEPGTAFGRSAGRLGLPMVRNGKRSIHCRRIKSQIYKIEGMTGKMLVIPSIFQCPSVPEVQSPHAKF